MNDNSELKSEVKAYWNKESCGTGVTSEDKFTRQYFDEIEAYRYSVEPEIFSFAQFTRYHGKKILEVGVGAGTDFLQWVRAGTQAYGVDLTEEAVEHVKNRLEIYGLKAEDVKVSDAENLPFPDNTFDLLYSWGVIHHSPDTIKAFEEVIRVTRPGGTIKLMIYNRRSLFAYHMWLYWGLMRLKPFRSIADILWYHQESVGTKAYTIDEVKGILGNYPVTINNVSARLRKTELIWSKNPLVRILFYLLAFLLGHETTGFFLTIDITKKNG